MRLAVCGTGKLGSCLAAALAAAGHEVVGIDPHMWTPPDETGLADLLASLPDDLVVTYRYAALAGCAASLIVVPTPSRQDGSFSTEYLLEAVRSIVAHTPTEHLIVVCSTVSPGTMAGEVVPLAGHRAVAYYPSFIALGSVLHDLRFPDQILIGAEDRHTHNTVAEIARSIAPAAPVHALSLTEAEITKLGVNAYITMKITWANLIAEGCESVGADPYAVLGTIGADSRIGNRYLLPGTTAAGPCLPRDSRALARFLDDQGSLTLLPAAVDRTADRQIETTIERLRPYGRVAVLGLSYKPDTAVTDHSFGLAVARGLAGACVVTAHDPQARPGGITLAASVDEAISGAHAVLIATAHEAYRGLDLGDRYVLDPWGMTKPR